MTYNQNFYIAILLGTIALVLIFILINSVIKKPKKNYFDKEANIPQNTINKNAIHNNPRINYPRRPPRRF